MRIKDRRKEEEVGIKDRRKEEEVRIKDRRKEEEVGIKDRRKEEEVRMKDGGRRKPRIQNQEADSDVLVGSIVRRMSSQNFFVIKKTFPGV